MLAFKPRRDKRGRLVCDCGGYSFPHRKFSGACYLGPRADYYSALRAGVSEADAAANLIWQDKLAAMPAPTSTGVKT